jgi:hypothetical protein
MKPACAALAIATLALAGCNATSSQGTSPVAMATATPTYARELPPGVTPPDFRLPSGSGCSGDVARWQAIQDNDLATGHVSKSVYDRIQAEITAAASVCQAGRDAEARGMISASKRRHGYPG